VVKDRKIIGVIDQSDEGGRIPRNQWGLVRRALASVALKVLDKNPGPPSDCTDAGWYQGNVKLIACEDERSAALYKAAINKVDEVYPVSNESEGVTAVGTHGTRGYTQPADQVQPETSNRRLEGGQGGEN